MKKLVQTCIKKRYTISSVESLTAGLFASKLAEVPHASSALVGGLITYQTKVKIDILGIDKKLIETYGVISKECAFEMAKKGCEFFHSDICVSFTGNAGPLAMDGKNVGLVYSCVCFKGNYYHFEWNLEGSRNEIRDNVCKVMEIEILSLLEDNE